MRPGETGGRRKDVLFAVGLLVVGVVGIGAALFFISRDGTPDGLISVSTASGTETGDTDTTPADADSDGLSDAEDPFALDPENGARLPVRLDFEEPLAGTIQDTGFTGVMSDRTTPYQRLVDPRRIVVGDGSLALRDVGRGDAVGAQNDQRNALQLGIELPDTPLTVHARLLAPFEGGAAEEGQAIGVFVGIGDQDNFVRLALLGDSQVELQGEDRGETDFRDTGELDLSGLEALDLYLTIDPIARTIRPQLRQTVDGETSVVATSLRRRDLPTRWIDGGPLAVGIIATRSGAGRLSATWDGLEVALGGPRRPPPGNGTTTTTEPTTTEEAVAVPDVLSQSLESASAELEAAGFVVGVVEAPSDDVPAGLVSDQSPDPGIEAPRGSTVRIAISTGPAELVTVPDLVGVTVEEAREKLQGSGFRARVVFRDVTDGDQDGIVLEQDPSAGAPAAAGSRVTIVVGRVVRR